MASQKRFPRVRLMALAALALAASAGIAGCAGIEPDTRSLPAGSELVATAGSAMRAVLSAHFSIDVHGSPAGVPFTHAEGDVDARGTARGSAELARSATTRTVDFVLVKGVFYVKGPTGGYQRTTPAASGGLFGLTSILNPNHGIARMVIGVNGATTTDKETVDGIQCYRITGTVAATNVAAVLPGRTADVPTTVWLAVSGAHLPVRAEFTERGDHNSRIDMSISDPNTPVTVVAPV